MTQLPLFAPPIWSVSKITRYLRDLFESDPALGDVWVEGEVSNLRRPGSGHVYFTVKDNTSALRCVMWRTTAQRQVFLPRDGDAIEIHGVISIYEADGQYQLYADLIRPAGEGQLFREFQRLKARLEAEGLFDQERKRPIPRWPARIGIVTSPTGAALRDMLNILRRRYPLVEVFLAPTSVQGEEAPAGIIAALQALNALEPGPDVILVARGGGSIEDLWAFNNEGVARAIAASAIPVVCGVGHETDFTIADFVSDLRAPTPTAAAELATPNRADLLVTLGDLVERLGRAAQTRLNEERWRLNRVENRLLLRSPQSRIASDRQRLDELTHRAGMAVQHSLSLEHARQAGLHSRLTSLNPQAILERGFAVVTSPDGQVVRRTDQAQAGQTVHIRVSDGSFPATVQPRLGKGRSK